MSSKGYRTYDSLFGNTAMTTDSAERVPVLLGVYIQFDAPGRLIGVRWFRDRRDDGHHYAVVRSNDNAELLRCAPFRNNAADAGGTQRWINTYFNPMLRVVSGTQLIVNVFSSKGYWWYTPALYATASYSVGPLTVPHHSGTQFNGLFSYVHEVTTEGDGGGNAYGVDVLFQAD